MMYLLDTNIWLERLLNQQRAEEVRQFLDEVPSDRLLMTDFSLHSIGIVLHRLDKQPAFVRFVEDLFFHGSVGLLTLGPSDMPRLVSISEQFGLDFDDAYQYLAAEQFNALLVSFDQDFDRTARMRHTPGKLLRQRPFLAD